MRVEGRGEGGKQREEDQGSEACHLLPLSSGFAMMASSLYQYCSR